MARVNSLQRWFARRYRRRLLGAAAVAAALVILRTWWGERIAGSPASPDDFSRYHDRRVQCVRVWDGDTIDVDLPDLTARPARAYTRIRLWGIDTPEVAHHGQPAMYFGPEAAAFARDLLDGQEVRLVLVAGRTRDCHGRLLAYVVLPDGRMYNRLALAEGLAYADRRFDHPQAAEFLELEGQARTVRAGLWRGVAGKDLPRWYPRQELRRARRPAGVPATTATGAVLGTNK